jgi:hypothetical protein
VGLTLLILFLKLLLVQEAVRRELGMAAETAVQETAEAAVLVDILALEVMATSLPLFKPLITLAPQMEAPVVAVAVAVAVAIT